MALDHLKSFFAPENRWRLLVLGVAGLALLVRLAIIDRHPGNWTDIEIYTYFAQLANMGLNPYDAPIDGPIDREYADFPPFEIAWFAALLKVHDGLDSLRVFFALADALVVGLIGWLYPRPRGWRLNMMAFYAFNPFVLSAWTLIPEDKNLYFFCTVIVLLSLERSWRVGVWLGATLLAVFKWVSGFFLLPLILYTKRLWGNRFLAIALGVFALVFLLSHVPWFPENLYSYARRNVRTTHDPGHASITQFVAELGLYDPAFVKVFIVAFLSVTYVLFLRRVFDMRETVVLALFGAFVALPDSSADRIILLALPFLLILKMTPLRWAIFWAVTTVSGVALAGSFFLPSRLHDVAAALYSPYASLEYVMWMNPFLVIVFALFVWDKIRGHETPDWKPLPAPQPSLR